MLALALVATLALPARAQEEGIVETTNSSGVAGDQVAVTFKENVGARFVAILNDVMGTATVRRQDDRHYTFRVGPRGTQNDFALFFAHLPYVQGVTPAPRLSGAEQSAPPVAIRVGAPGPVNVPGFVPRQLLVKFKPGVSREAIDNLNRTTGAVIKDQIEGIDVWLLQLPPNMSVDAARRLYGQNDLVQYAEPNRTYTLPPANPDTPIPPDNAGNGVYVSPNQLMGDHLLVRFKGGGPTVDVVNEVYGTHTIEPIDTDRFRITYPPGTNAPVAQHMFRICPYVLEVEPSYGR